MDIGKITKRIDESFGIDIKDIYGRRVYPGDLVYYVDGFNYKMKVGIVSKLTDKSCKILGSNRLFGNGDLCIVSGNENASLQYKKKYEDELKKFNEKLAERKKTKRKSIVFIGRDGDGNSFLGQQMLEFTTSKEMKEKMSFFSGLYSRMRFLCQSKDGEVYFSDDIFCKDLFFQPLSRQMLQSPCQKMLYLSSSAEMKESFSETIEEAKEKIIKNADRVSYRFAWDIKKDIVLVSRKEDVKLKSDKKQIFFDDDFLFTDPRYNDELVTPGYFISFLYSWLSILCANLFDVKYWTSLMNCDYDGVGHFFQGKIDGYERMYELYLLLKDELQQISSEKVKIQL